MIRDSRIAVKDELTLAVSVAGDPSHPPVVLLHGGGQTRHSWKNAQSMLAAEGHYVVAYDARGHGQSGWDAAGRYGGDELAADLLAVIAPLHQPVIVGASLGGLTALLAIGESEPTPARALVLVDVTTVLDNIGAQRVLSFMSANLRGFESLDEVADAIGRYNPARPRPSDLSGLRRVLREVDNRFYWHWDPRFLDDAKSKFSRDRLEAAARNINIPTLLVCGGRSDLVGPAEMAALRAVIPEVQLVEIPHAGHMIAGDRNDAFNAAIIAFLKKPNVGGATLAAC